MIRRELTATNCRIPMRQTGTDDTSTRRAPRTTFGRMALATAMRVVYGAEDGLLLWRESLSIGPTDAAACCDGDPAVSASALRMNRAAERARPNSSGSEHGLCDACVCVWVCVCGCVTTTRFISENGRKNRYCLTRLRGKY